MDQPPTKSDIEAVFQRLRALPANKACFDCGAKNPTWSSVTYGVFICIDCSAVHRSLGVHLTFVRSTQLDTNWTWMQLRQMQLGGNSNALQFFNQHNCVITDSQKKYNSRAAQLYRDKLQNLAANSLKNNKESILGKDCFLSDNKLHVTPHVEEHKEQKEVDFFQEHENFQVPDEQPIVVPKLESNQSLQNISGEGPNVDFNAKPEPLKKSTIGTRKPTTKKGGLGAKKSGLGATKVKTNFAELEREAAIVEEARQRALEESEKAAELSLKEQEEREAAIRLAYKDLSNEQMRKEEQLKKSDPKKAEQIERLGMGVGIREGISHSAFSDMHIIEQENVQSTPSTLSSLGKLRISEDNFFDDYSFGSGFNMNRNTYSKIDSFLSETSSNNSNSNSSSSNWVVVDDPLDKSLTNNKEKQNYSREKPIKTIDTTPSTDEAQKKFGNAKAISSEQFFNNDEIDYETKANINRFQGSSSISSSEFFGNGRDNNVAATNYAMSNYDLDDVKESVRQGVTKVAGKLSSLANGVMSSLQDRYGY